MSVQLGERLRLQAIVTDIVSARSAVAGGATAIQLRLKGASTDAVVRAGGPFGELATTFIVNDDVEAAIALDADGVHLGAGDQGVERALDAGLILGMSASYPQDAVGCEGRGAAYIGCGPVWPTPSKPDAGDAIGLDGLALVCRAVRIPVVAIGGVDVSNAGACIEAGAAGVAVIRAASSARAVREAVEAALGLR